MVRDGIYYGLALAAGGWVASHLASPVYGLPLYILAAFCLYFFRDPERLIPAGAVAVSPADGKIISIRRERSGHSRISIFMNVFDVHVNRAPISGIITSVDYQPGKFLVASRDDAATQNEQNTVSIERNGTRVVFTQIAGLIARRIVFRKKPGDAVEAGERIGLIKFGSRVDGLLGPEWHLLVREGERVKAGSSVLASMRDSSIPAVERGAKLVREKLEPGWAG